LEPKPPRAKPLSITKKNPNKEKQTKIDPGPWKTFELSCSTTLRKALTI